MLVVKVLSAAFAVFCVAAQEFDGKWKFHLRGTSVPAFVCFKHGKSPAGDGRSAFSATGVIGRRSVLAARRGATGRRLALTRSPLPRPKINGQV